jgi:hypothetical protein
MKKLLASSARSLPLIITEEVTRIDWTYNLTVNVPVQVGEISVEGNKLHEKLKRTLLNSGGYDTRGNSLVATLSLVASNETTAQLFQLPIISNFDNRNYLECFTDSAVYEVDDAVICKHINQRMGVAKDFMNLSLPVNYMPQDLNEFLWRAFHSEQALIEYLFKTNSLDHLMGVMLELGIKKFNHIEAAILDIHSKYYVCEFCEVSLFGLQDPKNDMGWLKSTLEPALKKGGFTFSSDGISMLTRISADTAFPRLAQKDIMPTQVKLEMNNLGLFNNQVILAKDMSGYKKLDSIGFSPISLFRSGSCFTIDNEELPKKKVKYS